MGHKSLFYVIPNLFRDLKKNLWILKQVQNDNYVPVTIEGMAVIKVDDTSVDYLECGKGSPMVFLPGWGKRKEDYRELISLLSEKYHLFAPDLPGFGSSDLPPEIWDVARYADFLKKLVAKLRFEGIILAGHSFGGRVAIKFTVNYPAVVEKLILIDSSGVEKKSPIVKVINFLSPILPSLLKNVARRFIGSDDYLKTKGLMRETFKNIVNENLEADLAKIKNEALIVWGENDRTTPLRDGRFMQKLIKGSKLIVVKGADHGLPYRKPHELAKILFKNL